MSNHKIHVHPGYLAQLARVAKLLEKDYADNRSNVMENMLYIKDVRFSVDGDDETIASLVYDQDTEDMQVEFSTKNWGV